MKIYVGYEIVEVTEDIPIWIDGRMVNGEGKVINTGRGSTGGTVRIIGQSGRIETIAGEGK